MNLIQQRRLAKLAKQNTSIAQPKKTEPSESKGPSKLRQGMQKTSSTVSKSQKLESQIEGVKDDVNDLDNRVDWVESDIEKIKDRLGDGEYIGNPELETHKVIVADTIDEMLHIEDIEDRKAYKAEAIVKLEAFVNGYVKGAAKYPNIVAVWFMIWMFDLGDIARALPLGLHLAKQKIHRMPERFSATIYVFICDQVYDWANDQLKANRSAGPYLYELIKTMEQDSWQLPDVVRGKMYVMLGKHLYELTEYPEALSAFEKAMAINPRAGAKGKINELTEKLGKKKSEKNA